MAENILEALMGGEPEEAEAAAPAIGAHPFAVALAAEMSRHDPEVAAETANFLRRQTQVLKVQQLALEDEHEFFEAQWLPRLVGTWLKTGFRMFTALVAALLGVGALVMLSDAVTSHAVVIDAFKAPSALAGRGLTGEVVAGGLLDELTRLQAATHASVSQRRLANDWTGGIKIEVPETGVSIGEVSRLLHERFGHDLHIGGDLVQSESGGLMLTVRGDGVLPKAFIGGPGDLERLTAKAAEYVYGESQPGLFGYYLGQMGRNDEAIAFAKSHLAGAGRADQPRLLNTWALALLGKAGPNATAQALPLLREAVRLQPDFWNGYSNIQSALSSLGDEEGGVQVGRQMLKLAGGRPGRAPEFWYLDYDESIFDVQATRAELLAGLAVRGGAMSTAGSGGAEMLGVVQADVQLHEIDAARLLLATTIWDPNSHFDAAAHAGAQAYLAEEVGDLPAAAKAWDDYAAAYADPKVSAAVPASLCGAAPTYQKTGQPAKADAALDSPLKAVGTGRFVDCYRFRGDVLDLRGDWTAAQSWYAKAAALAPSIPSGNDSWGMALARHGDLPGAAARFAAANQAGPHWAGPLKGWGDVLMRQGQARAALTKYDLALKYAPQWTQLHQARDAAARRGT